MKDSLQHDKLAQPDIDKRINFNDLSVANLIKRGYVAFQARAIIDYANMLTGSQRVVDDKFMQLFRQREASVHSLGFDVKQETIEFGNNGTPIRKYYTADWQRPPEEYVPRGQRGKEDVQVVEEIEKSIVIRKIIHK